MKWFSKLRINTDLWYDKKGVRTRKNSEYFVKNKRVTQ